jgi:hypothetical protein
MQVQRWLADVPEGEKDSHTAVVCLACDGGDQHDAPCNRDRK